MLFPIDIFEPISHDEAAQILKRFCNSHFCLDRKKYEHARMSIPADPQRDDDLRLAAYIEQCRAREFDYERSRAAACESAQLRDLINRVGLLLGRAGDHMDNLPEIARRALIEARIEGMREGAEIVKNDATISYRYAEPSYYADFARADDALDSRIKVLRAEASKP